MARYLMTFSKSVEDRLYFRYVLNKNRVNHVDQAKKLKNLDFLQQPWDDNDHYQEITIKNSKLLTLEAAPEGWDEYEGFTAEQRKLAKDFMTADSLGQLLQMYKKAQESCENEEAAKFLTAEKRESEQEEEREGEKESEKEKKSKKESESDHEGGGSGRSAMFQVANDVINQVISSLPQV